MFSGFLPVQLLTQFPHEQINNSLTSMTATINNHEWSRHNYNELRWRFKNKILLSSFLLESVCPVAMANYSFNYLLWLRCSRLSLKDFITRKALIMLWSLPFPPLPVPAGDSTITLQFSGWRIPVAPTVHVGGSSPATRLPSTSFKAAYLAYFPPVKNLFS